MTETRPQAPLARIVGVDVVRSVAIIAAMGSHCMIEAGVFNGSSGPLLTGARFLLQLSPPLFIGLFGAMLEIVYRRRFEQGQGLQASRQLLSRAVQCYGLYVLTLLAMVAVDRMSPGFFVRCAMLVGVTPYTDILKFYAIVLLAAPLILTLRVRFGLWPLVLLAVAIQCAYPLLSAIPHPTGFAGGNYAELPAAFLYGGGEGVGGPSVLHGLCFVFLGMLVGHASGLILSEAPEARRRGQLIASAMILLAAGATALLWDWSAPLATVGAIADMSLRNHNHPTYFALGVAVMMLTVWVALLAYDRGGAKFGRGVAFMGSTSLFTFGFGNILIYVAPTRSEPGALSLLYAAGLLALVLLQSYGFHRTMTEGKAAARAGAPTVAAAFYRRQNRIIEGISAIAGKAAAPYFALLARRWPRAAAG